MKYLVVAFLLCSISLHSQTSEHDAVKQTLNYYLEGGTNNDFDMLKMAFHEDATMKYIRGEYKAVNAIEFFQGIMKSGPPQNRKTSIEYVDISGPAAHARLRIDYPNFSFIDYMNLLKIDGEWKIVSKIFNRVNNE